MVGGRPAARHLLVERGQAADQALRAVQQSGDDVRLLGLLHRDDVGGPSLCYRVVNVRILALLLARLELGALCAALVHRVRERLLSIFLRLLVLGEGLEFENGLIAACVAVLVRVQLARQAFGSHFKRLEIADGLFLRRL